MPFQKGHKTNLGKKRPPRSGVWCENISKAKIGKTTADTEIRDIIGKKFGKLTVLGFAYVKKHKSYWLCSCSCGNQKIILGSSVKNGYTKSCGCMSCLTPKHGMAKTRFYRIWKGAKTRCLNKNNERDYKKYGGRGINVSDRWLKFESFKEDMYENYLTHVKEFGEKNTTIDRINNNGNYCKENCRWATLKEQGNNQKTNHLITYKNQTLTLSQWAEKLNLSVNCLQQRILKGWNIEKCFIMPQGKHISHK